jgi:hypothetical protein
VPPADQVTEDGRPIRANQVVERSTTLPVGGITEPRDEGVPRGRESGRVGGRHLQKLLMGAVGWHGATRRCAAPCRPTSLRAGQPHMTRMLRAGNVCDS